MKTRLRYSSSSDRRVVISLEPDVFTPYVDAASILKALMGAKAPVLQELIVRDLCGRDPDGIADNYLDGIQWPLGLGRSVTIRLREKSKGREKSPRPRPTIACSPRPRDLFRN